MSVLIKNMEMPKGCIYANDNDQTEYCPLLNHDDVPFCRYIESEPEIAIGIDERPAYCPLSDVPDTNVGDTISRQAAIEAVKDALLAWSSMPQWRDDKITEALVELPSAQPDNQVNLCDSCKHTYHDCPSQNDDVIFGNGNGDDNICACAKYAPSAQLEIIRCKDCKWFGDIGCAISIVDDTDKPSEEDYCSFAERRTDE